MFSGSYPHFYQWPLFPSSSHHSGGKILCALGASQPVPAASTFLAYSKTDHGNFCHFWGLSHERWWYHKRHLCRSCQLQYYKRCLPGYTDCSTTRSTSPRFLNSSLPSKYIFSSEIRVGRVRLYPEFLERCLCKNP